MMSCLNNNCLIVIENGRLKSYDLDNKIKWMVGRPSGESKPDIKLHSKTVSRKHGYFENENGQWFYVDTNERNGTMYNGQLITKGIGGRLKPKMLENGDILIFGSKEAKVSSFTTWAMFSDKKFDESWRVEDTKGVTYLRFSDVEKTETYKNPLKGTVIEFKDGEAIYMGDLTYLAGDIKLSVE